MTHKYDQMILVSEYRMQLFEYRKQRMKHIAPNLTSLVGELVGAQLISHAGSLLNLATHPAITVQILRNTWNVLHDHDTLNYDDTEIDWLKDLDDDSRMNTD